ncbi:U2 snRNP component ist3 [Candida viswanathii]|uniref:U2 snRNP component ist3 n=1 Tax=Candida viswanathii TaxID=5486 RepID=A0A367Y4I4_9ASCO|nr:U2 snRNP component ist3 [Candida viswanathii]
MNTVKQINQINQKELNSNTPYKSSWHYDYRDTNYIYIGNIPFNLAEQDVIIIFSQYGIPTHINLVKDKETGKHRGFGFLKYANFKSCILAIDNFNGIKLGDRILRVDHNYYKLRGNEKEDDYLINYDEVRKEIEEKGRKEQVKLIEDKKDSLTEGKTEEEEDEELRDPMADFLSKKEDKVEQEDEDEFKDPMEQFIKDKKEKRSKHRSHRSHRHRSHRHRSSERERERSRSPSR